MLDSCCRCGQEYTSGETITLTSDERALLGPDAPATFSYCAACLRMIRSPQHGPQLYRADFEQLARSKGHPAAARVADQFYEWLLKRTVPK